MMKKILVLSFILALLAIACCPASAQTPEKVGDPTSYMTAEQLAKYQGDIRIAELEKKLEVYGNWVGVGGEVGNAVREGLTAVVDVADQFGSTDVGKFTMVLVAWKVIGKDVVRIALGLIFFTLVTLLFLKVYRGYFKPRKIPVKRVAFFKRFVESVEYKIIEPDKDWEGRNAIPIVMLVLYAGMVGITYAIMFAN
jgi:hypothetical protein